MKKNCQDCKYCIELFSPSLFKAGFGEGLMSKSRYYCKFYDDKYIKTQHSVFCGMNVKQPKWCSLEKNNKQEKVV